MWVLRLAPRRSFSPAFIAFTRPDFTSCFLHSVLRRWYVLANIPLYVEQGATNCVENYAWNEERGGVDVLFEYLPKGGFLRV